METSIEQLKENGNKVFWFVVIVLLGAWFFNEYTTTKRLVREQASVLYSNLFEQFKSFNKEESSSEANNKLTENLNRFKSELDRLSTEFEGSDYADFANLFRASYGLSNNDVSRLDKLGKFLSTGKFSDVASNPIQRVKEELASLIKARSLAFTSQPSSRDEGLKSLKDLMSSSEYVAVDAAVSYMLALSKDEYSKEVNYEAVKQLLSKRPELQDKLDEQLAKYGLFILNSSKK